MDTLLVAVGAFFAYLIAYHTYGRWLARRIFRLDASARCPSREVNDGVDFVPTRRGVVFGHHFTSIAGTGPIVGPAIAVFWGWLPALLWVLVGSIFIGAVHDLGALVVSLRSRGQTIGDAAARMINRRARLLFLTILFVALAVVIGIFGLVIATIFAAYPGSVFPIWVQIPIAIAVGFHVQRRGGGIVLASLLALLIMLASVALGGYFLRFDLTHLGMAPDGAAAVAAGQPAFMNAVVTWTMALLVYCYFASVLPVWVLLQPRDFINSNMLLLALGALSAGLAVAAFTGGMSFVAPAINALPADFGAPPIWPFLFITIACGAISGFHCLVASGTTSKQLACESHAQAVGFGAMLLEGGLAVIVIIACCAGLGRGVYRFDADTGRYQPVIHSESGAPITGREAWGTYYSAARWSDFRLRQQIGGFVEGGANMLAAIGIPATYGINLMAVLVAAFAATTLDTATRLQRYVVSELAGAIGWSALRGKYAATTVAVVSGGAVALTHGPTGPGSGGLILWPIFGATNQLLAGLSFLVIAFYLMRHNRPIWFLAAPLALMLVLPNWAMALNMHTWLNDPSGPRWALLGLGGLMTVLQAWMILEAAMLWRNVRGVAPAPLPT